MVEAVPSYGILPGLPDDYTYQVLEQPSKPLIPLQTRQASLGVNDVPWPVWILLGVIALGAIGLLALAMTRKR